MAEDSDPVAFMWNLRPERPYDALSKLIKPSNSRRQTAAAPWYSPVDFVHLLAPAISQPNNPPFSCVEY